EAGCVIPTRRRALGTIAARGHVVERRGRQLVELRRGEADARALGGDHARPEPNEQRRRQAGTTPLLRAAVDDDDGAAVGIGIKRNVGYATRGVAGVLTDAHLPTRHRLESAGAATRAGPGRLALPRRGGGIQCGAPHGDHVWRTGGPTRGGAPRASLATLVGTGITRGHRKGLPLRIRLLENRISRRGRTVALG